jgi:hypothetical protein
LFRNVWIVLCSWWPNLSMSSLNSNSAMKANIVMEPTE